MRLHAASVAPGLFAAILATPVAVRAQEIPEAPNLPVGFSADELHLDTRSQALDATGHVRVDEPPFHLSSDALRLRRVRIGAELEALKVELTAPSRVRLIEMADAPRVFHDPNFN